MGQPLKMPALDYTETEVEKPGFDVTVEAPDLCPRYIAHYVYDVKLAQSPAWMRRRLALVGNNSICLLYTSCPGEGCYPYIYFLVVMKMFSEQCQKHQGNGWWIDQHQDRYRVCLLYTSQ